MAMPEGAEQSGAEPRTLEQPPVDGEINWQQVEMLARLEASALVELLRDTDEEAMGRLLLVVPAIHVALSLAIACDLPDGPGERALIELVNEAFARAGLRWRLASVERVTS